VSQLGAVFYTATTVRSAMTRWMRQVQEPVKVNSTTDQQQYMDFAVCRPDVLVRNQRTVFLFLPAYGYGAALALLPCST